MKTIFLWIWALLTLIFESNCGRSRSRYYVLDDDDDDDDDDDYSEEDDSNLYDE